MNREQIMNAIRNLAQSQGSYGRMLESIENADPDAQDKIFAVLETQNFGDAVDLVLFLEC